MKAVCWQGANNVRVETVPEPKIINPREIDPSFVITHSLRLGNFQTQKR